MKQRVVLIQANLRKQGAPSLGVGYLASYLRKKIDDIDVAIFETIPKDMRAIEELSPTVVGVSVLTQQFPYTLPFLEELKERIDVPVIMGGSHITAVPELLPPSCDIGVLSEGEETLYQILRQEAFTPDRLAQVEGVAYHDNGGVVTTPLRPLIEEIDGIPPPARDLLDMKHFLKGQNVFGPYIGRGSHMFTSRGCPYRCPFCFSSKFWRATIRDHSPEYVVSELAHLVRHYGAEMVHIFDDLFTVHKKRMRRIAELMEGEGLNREVKLGVVGRCDLFDDETGELLKRMNVIHVTFGFESGCQKTLDFLKNGRLTTEHIRNAVRLCRKYGFTVDGSFIIGSPGETEEEMLETLEFIKSLKLDKFAFATATPYPGTKFWEIMKERGLIGTDIDWRKLNTLNREMLEDVDNQFLMIDGISKDRFLEVWDMFEKERRKFWSYDWRKNN